MSIDAELQTKKNNLRLKFRRVENEIVSSIRCQNRLIDFEMVFFFFSIFRHLSCPRKRSNYRL